MKDHQLPPYHRAALDKAVPMQLQTLLQRPDTEAIWDAFHLLDCVHFRADHLGPEAVQAIHAALWSSLQSLHDQKRYKEVASWCPLALHPCLLAHCSPSNLAKFQRRLLGAYIELGEYAEAFTLLQTLPDDNALATHFLGFRLAVRAEDHGLARSCLGFFAARPDRNEARDALYACVREAQRAGDRVKTVEALSAAAATWKGEAVVAGNVAALLRCAIRLLQAEEALDAQTFVATETVNLFGSAAEFVTDNARDDHGDAVFRGAELCWFATNAYNIGVARCTTWDPGRLAALFHSCLVFCQALVCSAGNDKDGNDKDDTAAADAPLTVLRCHFVLAALYAAEARAANNEHTLSLYADVEKHATAYTQLFAKTCAADDDDDDRYPDLRGKLGALCVFQCEALLARRSYEHVPCVVKQAARLCRDAGALKALGGCVIQSDAPVPVKSSILKSTVNEIFSLENFKSDRLAQYIRCMVQVLLPAAAGDDVAARDILDQAVQVADESKQVGVPFPVEEAEWLAAAAFNHGLAKYAARGGDMAACNGWLDRAVAMARHVDDDGRFAASLQERRQTLVNSSLAGAL